MPTNPPDSPPYPSPNPSPLILTTLTLCFFMYILFFGTIIVLYFTGCFITETSITTTAYTSQSDENSKGKDGDGRCDRDSEVKALLAAKGELMMGMEREERRVVETQWRTTKVRVWGREAILWSFGKGVKVDSERVGEKGISQKGALGGKKR
ncbi:hypothetical protein IFR04_012510 [Cadophora malorum]|uniref:Uncharacterized protein n=1 Tax=Cadophora malorum TaxID=108018 RepID=A0A8H7W6R0_9HELO|nr:hypothetical protein IFR04_012510 [Cadophora malorum]